VAELTTVAEINAGGVKINAGLLTGNAGSTCSKFTSNGGAQNLVRYQEDWSGVKVTFYGSIGRLFQSTQFTKPFTGPGKVYMPPKNRNFDFDENLQKYPQPEFHRG
jgi:hypothetical protein